MPDDSVLEVQIAVAARPETVYRFLSDRVGRGSRWKVRVHLCVAAIHARRSTRTSRGDGNEARRIRFGWSAALPDGTAVGAGVNFGELAVDGRFARMTGFWETSDG